MIEAIVGILFAMTLVFFYFGWPILSHFFKYQKERE